MMELETLHQVAKVRRMAQTGAARKIREEAGMTKAEMAAVVGVSDNSIKNWERGRTTPRADLAARWLKVLDSIQ